MRRFAVPAFLIRLLMGLIFLAAQPHARAGEMPLALFKQSCLQLLQRVFKSEAQTGVEQILADHAPKDAAKLHLVPVYESSQVTVFRGKPDQIYKWFPLSDALNDYHALKVLQEENENLRSAIKIIDVKILIPKAEGVTLATRVVQQGPALEGRILFDVLADPAVPNERKQALRDRFETWLQEMKVALADRGYRGVIQLPQPWFFVKNRGQSMADQPAMFSAKKSWRSLVERDFSDLSHYSSLDKLSQGNLLHLLRIDEDIHIILKSDNIFVDSNDELTLFDPQ